MLADAESFIWWEWLARHRDLLLQRALEHAQLTGIAVGIGLVISVVCTGLAQRWRFLRSPLDWIATWLYTIPSLALFGFLIPFTGASFLTAEIALVAYSLFILVANLLAGLDAVPAASLDAADAMGMGASRRFLTVQLPLALPAALTGVRLAMVSTIALTTITFQVGYGGFGALIDEGIRRNYFSTEIVAGATLAVISAVVIDRLLAFLTVALTPWTRATR